MNTRIKAARVRAYQQYAGSTYEGGGGEGIRPVLFSLIGAMVLLPSVVTLTLAPSPDFAIVGANWIERRRGPVNGREAASDGLLGAAKEMDRVCGAWILFSAAPWLVISSSGKPLSSSSDCMCWPLVGPKGDLNVRRSGCDGGGVETVFAGLDGCGILVERLNPAGCPKRMDVS